MNGLDRITWSFVAIAIFAVFVIWFRRRQSSPWVGLISIAVAIAVTIGLAMKLIAE